MEALARVDRLAGAFFFETGRSKFVKVLLLDIDLIPQRSPQPLFELKPPAALARGRGMCRACSERVLKVPNC